MEFLLEFPTVCLEEINHRRGSARSFELSLDGQRVDGALDLAETLGSLGSLFPTEHGDELNIPLTLIVLLHAVNTDLRIVEKTAQNLVGVQKGHEIGSLGEDVDDRILRHSCHFLSIIKFVFRLDFATLDAQLVVNQSIIEDHSGAEAIKAPHKSDRLFQLRRHDPHTVSVAVNPVSLHGFVEVVDGDDIFLLIEPTHNDIVLVFHDLFSFLF